MGEGGGTRFFERGGGKRGNGGNFRKAWGEGGGGRFDFFQDFGIFSKRFEWKKKKGETGGHGMGTGDWNFFFGEKI